MSAHEDSAPSTAPVDLAASSTPGRSGSRRRSYSQPCLVVYGTLADLTRFVGNDVPDGAIGTTQTT